MMTPATKRRPSARAAEYVADAANRVDEGRVRRVGLDAGTQPVDVDIDGARLAAVVVAPHVLEQLVASEDLAWVTDQEGEQLERLRLDRHDRAIAQQAVSAEIGLDRSEIDDGRRTVDRDCLVGSAEEGADQGAQLSQAERLCDVVVGTELEAYHLVQLGILGGQH